jgi:hypothetical protein
MHCQECGKMMEALPDLYFHSGKSWYGCNVCDIVIESNYCSVSGRPLGTTPCLLSYRQFKARMDEEKRTKG